MADFDLTAAIAAAIAAVDRPENGYQYTRGNIVERDIETILTAALPEIRERLQEADKGWNDAVDWLLNSAHCGDPEIQAAFWLLADGGCTRDEASKGFMADGRNIVDAHNDHDGMISHGRRR